MTYPVISLFSGAMGLDLGLKKAGLDIKIAQDINPWCAKTMEANRYPYVLGDIRKLVAEDPECNFLTRPTELGREEAFAVVGGPPCQPFSTAGKRLSTNDPRGSLFMEFSHVIRTLRPRFFVMENVKGLLSVAINNKPLEERDDELLTDEEQPGSAFELIKRTFMDLGYKIEYGVLDAVHYGVPQFRERLIIIGSRDNEDIFLPTPTHFQRHQDPSYRWQTIRDVIKDLEDNPGLCATLSSERLRYLRMVPMGGNWRSLPKDLIPLAMGGAFESGGGKVGFYRRLDYDQPSPTLVTSPVQKATMFCHPTKHRPLSVREYARIQQFPDDWKIEGQVSECYRQIGNAVPIGLGRAIGQTLLAIANKNSQINTRRLRGTSVHEKLVKNSKAPFRELAGQAFWQEITGDADFYLKIIRLMKDKPHKHTTIYHTAWDAAVNRFTKEFIDEFCHKDGSIDWEELTKFNSGISKKKQENEEKEEKTLLESEDYSLQKFDKVAESPERYT